MTAARHRPRRAGFALRPALASDARRRARRCARMTAARDRPRRAGFALRPALASGARRQPGMIAHRLSAVSRSACSPRPDRFATHNPTIGGRCPAGVVGQAAQCDANAGLARRLYRATRPAAPARCATRRRRADRARDDHHPAGPTLALAAGRGLTHARRSGDGLTISNPSGGFRKRSIADRARWRPAMMIAHNGAQAKEVCARGSLKATGAPARRRKGAIARLRAVAPPRHSFRERRQECSFLTTKQPTRARQARSHDPSGSGTVGKAPMRESDPGA